jgi:uncharacterized protein YegL
MKKGYTHITIVLDKSGSMMSKQKEVIQGFNDFIDKQRAMPGEATLSLVVFNQECACPIPFGRIQSIYHITEATYRPEGWTALLDALGWAIDETGRVLSLMKEEDRPEKVIFCILTDGEENHSKEYKLHQVKEMVLHQQQVYKWEFIFVGAGIDAFTSADRLGIQLAHGVPATTRGVAQAMSIMSVATSDYRSGGSDALRANYIQPKVTH